MPNGKGAARTTCQESTQAVKNDMPSCHASCKSEIPREHKSSSAKRAAGLQEQHAKRTREAEPPLKPGWEGSGGRGPLEARGAQGGPGRGGPGQRRKEEREDEKESEKDDRER